MTQSLQPTHTLMNIEELLSYLRAKKVTINEVVERLGMRRDQLYTIKDGANERRKEDTAEKIIAAFPDQFPGGEIPPTEEEGELSLAKKYIKLLERTVERLEAENAKQRQEMDELSKKIFGKN